MHKKIKITLLFLLTIVSISAFSFAKSKQKDKNQEGSKEKSRIVAVSKTDTVKTKQIEEIATDTLSISENLRFKFYKKNAHASYYHSRFEGKRTASGKRFSNKNYTAAHKKLPFGTKVKVTNEANGKSVIVEITDRGPFTKAREIDLSKRAFMDIASNKNSGSVIVKLEVEEK
ncbi:MAG: septal ring lytic transglycosylase RlpA family protein [Flavobacterium sp.]